MRRAWLVPLGWLLAAPLLAGCGEGVPEAPPLPTGKVPPSLPRQVRGLSTDAWLSAAASGDATVRAEALLALGELLGEDAALAPWLARGLLDPDAGVRHAAVLVAGRRPFRLEVAAEQALVRALAAAERGTARAAAVAVEARGALSASALAEGLAAGDERLALACAASLAALGPVAEPAAPALVAAARSDSLARRLASVRALERMGAAAVAPIAEALPGLAPEAGLPLLEVLRLQGAGALRAWPALRALLAHADPDMARAAAEAVVALGPPALPLLEQAADVPSAASLAARIRDAAGR